MADSRGSIDHRIATVQGQLGALSRMLKDGDETCYRCARVLNLIDGSWASIRRMVVKQWLEEALEGLPEEEREAVEDTVDGLRRITGRP